MIADNADYVNQTNGKESEVFIIVRSLQTDFPPLRKTVFQTKVANQVAKH